MTKRPLVGIDSLGGVDTDSLAAAMDQILGTIGTPPTVQVVTVHPRPAGSAQTYYQPSDGDPTKADDAPAAHTSVPAER